MLARSTARKYIGSLIGIGLAVFLSACGGTAPLISSTAEPSPPPSVIPATPTAFPTAHIAPTMTFPPLTEIAIQPLTPFPTLAPVCEDAPSSRMMIGERGRVGSQDMRPLNVRANAGTEGRILGRLEVGDVFRVLDGAVCSNGFVWYYVERVDGRLKGWVAEGEFGFYYIEPYLTG